MSRPFRVYIDVRYSHSEKLWKVVRRDISGGVLAYERTRRGAIQRGRSEAKLRAIDGLLVELVIHNQDGSIGKGQDSRSTYGADPRKSKG